MAEDRESEPPPSLLLNYGQFLQSYLIYSPSQNRFRILNDFPELHNVKVVGSSYGWLFLADENENCQLFNPISRDIIELPDNLTHATMYTAFIFTKPPNETDCHVFLSGNWDQAFCRIEDDEFVIHEEPNRFIRSIVSFQGQIYGFMCPNHEFVTIHVVDKTLEFRPILLMDEDGSCPWVIRQSSLSYDIWLIESSDELLMVQKIYLSWHLNSGVDFRIFRVDINLKRCIEVENIGDRTIFLADDGASYCCRVIGAKPNSIYYTNEVQFEDRNMYIFDLEDRSRISVLPSRIVGHKRFTASWVQGINL